MQVQSNNEDHGVADAAATGRPIAALRIGAAVAIRFRVLEVDASFGLSSLRVFTGNRPVMMSGNGRAVPIRHSKIAREEGENREASNEEPE